MPIYILAPLAVLVGAALALHASSAGLGAMRVFTLLTVSAAVFLGLLPDALHHDGSAAFIAFVAGWAIPAMLDRRLHAHDHIGAELTWWVLAVHTLIDGFGLAFFSNSSGGAHANQGVVTALIAHQVPIGAIVALSWSTRQHRLHGWLRAGGLAVALVLGIWLAHHAPIALFDAPHTLIAAATAGLLLHMLLHDPSLQVPISRISRLLGFTAACLVILLTLPPWRDTFQHDLLVFINLASRAAPWLILANIIHRAFDRRYHHYALGFAYLGPFAGLLTTHQLAPVSHRPPSTKHLVYGWILAAIILIAAKPNTSPELALFTAASWWLGRRFVRQAPDAMLPMLGALSLQTPIAAIAFILGQRIPFHRRVIASLGLSLVLWFAPSTIHWPVLDIAFGHFALSLIAGWWVWRRLLVVDLSR